MTAHPGRNVPRSAYNMCKIGQPESWQSAIDVPHLIQQCLINRIKSTLRHGVHRPSHRDTLTTKVVIHVWDNRAVLPRFNSVSEKRCILRFKVPTMRDVSQLQERHYRQSPTFPLGAGYEPVRNLASVIGHVLRVLSQRKMLRRCGAGTGFLNKLYSEVWIKCEQKIAKSWRTRRTRWKIRHFPA